MKVTGRNGFEYDATHLVGSFYIVGKFIVLVEDSICVDTLCRATKNNIAKYSQ